MMNTERIYHTELTGSITAVAKAAAMQTPCLIEYHAMKMYKRVELLLLAFLISAPHLRRVVMTCSLKNTGLFDITANA
jgi:hypothetical protein